MDENTIGIVTFKVMFKGSDFIQIGLNDDPDEVFNFLARKFKYSCKMGDPQNLNFSRQKSILEAEM